MENPIGYYPVAVRLTPPHRALTEQTISYMEVNTCSVQNTALRIHGQKNTVIFSQLLG